MRSPSRSFAVTPLLLLALLLPGSPGGGGDALAQTAGCTDDLMAFYEAFGGRYFLTFPTNDVFWYLDDEQEVLTDAAVHGLRYLQLPQSPTEVAWGEGPIFRWHLPPMAFMARDAEEGDLEGHLHDIAGGGPSYDDVWDEVDDRGWSFREAFAASLYYSSSLAPAYIRNRLGTRGPEGPCGTGSETDGRITYNLSNLSAEAAVVLDQRYRGRRFRTPDHHPNGMPFIATLPAPAEATSDPFPIASFENPFWERAEEVTDHLYGSHTGTRNRWPLNFSTFEFILYFSIEKDPVTEVDDDGEEHVVGIEYHRQIDGVARRQLYWDPRVRYEAAEAEWDPPEEWFEGADVEGEEAFDVIKDQYVTTLDRWEYPVRFKSRISFDFEEDPFDYLRYEEYRDLVRAVCGDDPWSHRPGSCGRTEPNEAREIFPLSDPQVHVPGPDREERIAEMCETVMGDFGVPIGECFGTDSPFAPDMTPDDAYVEAATTQGSEIDVEMDEEAVRDARSGRAFGEIPEEELEDEEEEDHIHRLHSQYERVCRGEIEREIHRRDGVPKNPARNPDPEYPIECPEVLWPPDCEEMREEVEEERMSYPGRIYVVNPSDHAPDIPYVQINDGQVPIGSNGVGSFALPTLTPISVHVPLELDEDLGNGGYGQVEIHYYTFDDVCHPAFVDVQNPGPFTTFDEGGPAWRAERFSYETSGAGFESFGYGEPGGAINIFIINYYRPVVDGYKGPAR